MQAAAALGILLLLLVLHQLAWLSLRGLLSLATRWARPIAVSRIFVRDHPITAWTAARFPRSHAFVARRLHTKGFTGLPLTLIGAAALYIAALFGGLIDELFEAEGLVHADAIADRFAGYLRTELGFHAFLWITELGAAPTFVAVGLVSTAFLLIENRLAYVPALWTTLLGAQATTWVGKYAIDRTRPEFLEVATAVSPSFPSGHSTAAMAVYGFLAYLIVRRVPSQRVRFEVIYWTAVLIAAIGFSRIYLRVHFLSDVLSGLLVGGFWLLVGVAVAEWPRRAPPRRV
jgi:membrane-associated phospholipid phosphatase